MLKCRNGYNSILFNRTVPLVRLWVVVPVIDQARKSPFHKKRCGWLHCSNYRCVQQNERSPKFIIPATQNLASALTLLNNLQVYTVHLWRFLCLECCSNKVVLFLKLLFWVSYLHVYFLPMVCDAVGYQYGHIQNVIGNLKNYGWYQDIFVAKNLVWADSCLFFKEIFKKRKSRIGMAVARSDTRRLFPDTPASSYIMMWHHSPPPTPMATRNIEKLYVGNKSL